MDACRPPWHNFRMALPPYPHARPSAIRAPVLPLCCLVLLLGFGCAARVQQTPPPESGPVPQAQQPRAIGDPTYLAELLTEARRLRLWEERLWHLLMHYRDDWFLGGVTSEADGPGFFNAPDGKTNPQAELEATLARFFTTEILEPGKQTAQCTFVARYHWLKARLGFDPARLPELPCKRFDRWFAALDPGSVSLVFASHYLNNPASVFGHTLLLLNKRGRPESARMLNYAVNFGAAVPQEEPGMLFAVKGLFGGYRGHFSLMPYYLKLREYRDIESRDLWEYQLRFPPEQLKRMVRHAWEMGSTYFDYYFLDENCSYHLLSLLEVANPELRLRDHFQVWAMPTDTLRVVLDQAGVGVKVSYRPSRGQQLRDKLAHLAAGEQELVYSLIASPDNSDSAAFVGLYPLRQAMVMDAAVDFYQYKIGAARGDADPELKAALRNLLLRRSRVAVQAIEPPPAQAPTPPERGHNSSRWAFGAGEANGAEAFQELSLQAAFHRLMSVDSGYPPNSQINSAYVRFRHEDKRNRTLLEELALADVVSLSPMTRLEKSPSWKISAVWRRARDGGCQDCVPFVLNAGVGAALQSSLFSREVYFAMVDISLNLEDDFDKGFRAGFGAEVGAMVDILPQWRVGLVGHTTNFSEGDRSVVESSALRQRFSFTTDLELNLDFLWLNDYREGKLTLGYYF